MNTGEQTNDPRPQLWNTPNAVRDHQRQAAAALSCVAEALKEAMVDDLRVAIRSGDSKVIDQTIKAAARIAARAMRVTGDELLNEWRQP